MWQAKYVGHLLYVLNKTQHLYCFSCNSLPERRQSYKYLRKCQFISQVFYKSGTNLKIVTRFLMTGIFFWYLCLFSY